MQLEKILEEIDNLKSECLNGEYEPAYGAGALDMANDIKDIIRSLSRENDSEITRSSRDTEGWIPVEEPPKKDYTAVFAVDKHDYYFVAVYDKEHGYRTNDVGADVDNIVAYCLFNPYRPERSEE